MSDLKRRADIPVRHLECNGYPEYNGGLENPPSVERDYGEHRVIVDGNPYSIPDSWGDSSISEVVVKAKQRDPRKKPDEVFQYVDVSAVSNTSFKITGASLTHGSDAPSRARKAIETDDVIFATVRPTLKRIALVPPELDGAIASTGYCVLRCDKTKVLPGFLYSFLITDHFNARIAGLERGASYPAVRDSDVMSSWLPLPPLPEQKKIAHILSTVQKAIEAQERIIQTTTELKKALMHKLFTEGLRNEPQKETEIGLVPESWEVVELGCESPRLLTAMRNGYTGKQTTEAQKFSVSRIETIGAGYIDRNRVRYAIDPSQSVIGKYLIRRGDILFSHINSDPHLGKTGIAEGETSNLLHGMNLLLIRANQKVLNPWFLNFLFQWYREKGVFISICSRAVNQSSINQGKMNALEIPVPEIEEQEEIAAALGVLEEKTANHKRRRSILQDLFHALLHELMNAKTRVHELEINK
ncbi:MAG: hypothetical protein C1941_01470 [Prosthecochloris sp.]|nr:hypothetical protein [Prosthecochloris sp.]